MMLRARGFPTLRVILVAVLLALVTSGAGATIRYTVSVDHPEKHIFHVRMEIPDATREVTVKMPAWNTPYQIRDFSVQVRAVGAFASANQAPLENANQWTLRGTDSGTTTPPY